MEQMCVCCNLQAKMQCSTCKAKYCSKQCQLADWPKHRMVCIKPEHAVVSGSSSKNTSCVSCQCEAAMRCSRCKTIYCSDRCQLNDWENHKSFCVSVDIYDSKKSEESKTKEQQKVATVSQGTKSERKTSSQPTLVVNLQEKLDKETTRLLPPFTGLGLDRIEFIASGPHAIQAREELLQTDVWGFDTETKPTWFAGEISDGPHIVQLATSEKAWIFDLENAECRDVVGDLLTRPNITKAGFGLQSDVKEILKKLGIVIVDLLDLDTVFHRMGYRAMLGVRAAIAVLFNKSFVKAKKITTSNWAKRPLKPAQLLYAANDAYAAVRVWEALYVSGGEE